MSFVKAIVFCCVVTCFDIVALANRRERSAQVLDQDVNSSNDTMEIGSADSHEAMNNREEILPKIREKRSYEFLMGLINNNSRYEVTKVESELSTQKTTVTSENVAASEILLELMVRIAAHPDQWAKVHKLLQSIDQDLTSSRNVFEKLKKPSDSPKAEVQIKTSGLKNEEVSEETLLLQRNTSSSHNDHNNTKKFEKERDTKLNRWPTFDEDSTTVKFVNSNETRVNDTKVTKASWQVQNKPNKPTYPKNFAYHRVTALQDVIQCVQDKNEQHGDIGNGKPINLNKNPKAYIAVSVIAPKPTNTRSSQEDITLENELHQLKPWTHNQNLKNMASIRSRWVIQNEEDKKSAL